MPGWQGSDRRERLPDDWAKTRKRILRRDGFRCTARDERGFRCDEAATDVDHIIPGDDHRDENLTSLCGWHHAKKTGAEGARAKAKARARHANKFKRVETHPGLI